MIGAALLPVPNGRGSVRRTVDRLPLCMFKIYFRLVYRKWIQRRLLPRDAVWSSKPTVAIFSWLPPSFVVCRHSLPPHCVPSHTPRRPDHQWRHHKPGYWLLRKKMSKLCLFLAGDGSMQHGCWCRRLSARSFGSWCRQKFAVPYLIKATCKSLRSIETLFIFCQYIISSTVVAGSYVHSYDLLG